MVREYSKNGGDGWAPIGAPVPLNLHKMLDEDLPQHWSNFDSSVNAVSFGFVATAILISMFLLMAIFERFLRPSSSSSSTSSSSTTTTRNRPHLHSHLGFNSKLTHPSPKMSLYASWVSVMMPGDEIPTFIAHPAPAPCRPERILWPSHQHTALHCSSSNSLANNRSQV